MISEKSEIKRGMVGARNEMQATVWLLNHDYQVFRNVSAHGPIDLVAMKNNKFEYFDVKMAYRTSGVGRPRITKEQADLGVKIICVYSDGSCEIDDAPLVKGGEIVSCKFCEKDFVLVRSRQKFCSRSCSSQHWNQQLAESRLSNASA